MASCTQNMNAKSEMLTEKRDVCEEALKLCSQLKSYGVHPVSRMKAAGFQYTGDNDTARCNICGIEVSEWTREMNPFFIHLERSPNCSFVRSVELKNRSSLSSEENTTKRRKMETDNNQYNQQKKLIESNTFQQVRQRTFSHWLHQKTPAKEQMIHAGFFCTNVCDRVICMYCNLICQQWEKDIDDPIEVHKILSPKCPYVLSLSIQEEASSVAIGNGISTDNNNNQTTCTPITTNNQSLPITDENLLSRLVAARLDLPISQQLLNQNFKLSIIKRCWEDQLRLKHDDFVTDCDLHTACVILQKQIQYINGDKNNIIVPSIKMKSIRNNEQSST
ncbi:unnamed protein product [Adineta steineri]|uniref:Uncharacterized protein n=1 Tax=Adineta steineri TaxID=433720 RepID=A0A819LJ55_9BILA|nr:unnamed protein product [Adineta steineri]